MEIQQINCRCFHFGVRKIAKSALDSETDNYKQMSIYISNVKVDHYHNYIIIINGIHLSELFTMKLIFINITNEYLAYVFQKLYFHISLIILIVLYTGTFYTNGTRLY